MRYRLLADLLLILHLCFVIFVVFGGLWVLRRPRLAWFHLPAVVWGVWIEFAGGLCPLTPLENRLRRLAGEADCQGEFVERLLMPLLYPGFPDRGIPYFLGSLVLVFNICLYGYGLFRKKNIFTG